MQPTQAAALVAREADIGVASALSAVDAAGILVVDEVIARVAHVPEGQKATPLEDIVWQAEVVMSPTGAGRDGSPTRVPPLAMPKLLAALPVRALRGVGATWSARLVEAGLAQIGDLAIARPAALLDLARRYGNGVLELAGRARGLAAPWPELPATAPTWGSVVRIAEEGPAALGERTGIDAVLAHAVWDRCVATLSAVDDAPLATMSPELPTDSVTDRS
ncbi:hypothetical protein [Microbacterium sp.]|uniref:hypothetical protein n=1 Tax=Microbacterium sp. TaxID=51671 RepID=UPI003A8C304A